MSVRKGTKTGPRHFLCHTRENSIWRAMRQRCSNPNDQDYSEYGGRGITICKEWASFAAFYRDMGPIPSPKHSIDRIDNDGNYEPGNCRWASPLEQQNNRRNNRHYDWNGQRMTAPQIYRAAQPPVKFHTFHARLYYGWPIERAVSEPAVPPNKRRWGKTDDASAIG